MNVFKFPFKLCYSVLYYICYVIMWKEIIKRVIRYFTGTHEVERNVIKYNNYFNLKQCLMNSRQLSSQIKKFLESDEEDINNQERIEKMLNIINRVKGIRNPEFSDRFLRIMNSYFKVKEYKAEIKALYKEKFDIENKEHFEMLIKIWEILKGDRDIQLVDQKWLDIGFQGKDPTTDLRGAGMLGLRNLYYFVSESQENSMEVYRVASDAQTWYFFCASGINFTGKIIELIETNRLDVFLINYRGDIISFINNLYDRLFTNFNRFWVRKGIKSFMQFNTMLEEFMSKEVHKYLDNSLILKSQIY